MNRKIYFKAIEMIGDQSRKLQLRDEENYERNFKQAGAEFGQAQQLVFQIWGWFGVCCQRPTKSQIWICQELIVEA